MEKKELKDLDLLDRFLFAEAIEDPETMELILEVILGREIILNHLPQAEKEQRRFLWTRYLRVMGQGRGRCRLRYRSPEAEHEGSSEEEQTLQQSD